MYFQVWKRGRNGKQTLEKTCFVSFHFTKWKKKRGHIYGWNLGRIFYLSRVLCTLVFVMPTDAFNDNKSKHWVERIKSKKQLLFCSLSILIWKGIKTYSIDGNWQKSRKEHKKMAERQKTHGKRIKSEAHKVSRAVGHASHLYVLSRFRRFVKSGWHHVMFGKEDTCDEWFIVRHRFHKF